MRPYLDILLLPRMAPLLAISVLARLPIGVNALAVVLFLRAETGSFAVAGATAGALALGTALLAPLQGRVADRLGARALVPSALGHAAGLAGLLALGSADAPALPLVACGVVTGGLMPPIASVLRARYPQLVGSRPDLLASTFALDAVTLEVVLVGGPLVVALLVSLVDPAAALVLSAVGVVAGTALFVALLPLEGDGGGRPDGPRFLGALAAPGIRTLVASTFPIGFALGSMEVAVPAFAYAEGRPDLAGLLIAAFAVASATSGLLYGVRRRRASPAGDHVRIALLLPVAFLPIAAASSFASMTVLLVLAGALRAPFFTTRNELAGAAAPHGAETEAYTWVLTALVSGIALGAGVAGSVVDAAGWQTAVLVAAGAAAVGALVAVARREMLPA